MSDEWGDLRQLRLAGEALKDAIDVRVKTFNRIRSGSGDLMSGRQLSEKEIKAHPLAQLALGNEEILRDTLTDQYHQAVPGYVQDWAAGIPILRTGETFPRIVSFTGNPLRAIPLKMEGTGKDRKAVPDGEPYRRSLRQFWQWCGAGDPDLVNEKGNQAILLRRGKVRTIRPLLYTFSKQLVMASARSLDVRDSEYYKLYRETKNRLIANPPTHYKTCRNHKIPPMKPDGCGIAAHPEWGEPGSPWRRGHMDMHAHRMLQKELLRQFWKVVRDHEES